MGINSPKPRIRNPTFFASAAHWRRWLEKHAGSASELVVGFHKKSSGRPCIAWSESVDEALCFGWIDGIRKSRDELSYTIRFTPRRPGSIWSAINIKKVHVLTEQGKMRPAGLKAFENRRENKVGKYSYENRPERLEKRYAAVFRQQAAAWEFFQSLPPSYRRTTTWWILSAKTEATRQTRLAKLIDESAKARRIDERYRG